MNEQNTGIGKLVIRVSAADAAIPITDALVRIRGGDADNSKVIASLRTDRNGLTPPIPLPAPPRGKSLAPDNDPNIKPFSVFSIDVEAQGYYPNTYSNVPVFDGITSVQNAAMLPLEGGAKENDYKAEPIDYRSEEPDL